MADGRHFDKKLNRNRLTDYDEIWHGDAQMDS